MEEHPRDVIEAVTTLVRYAATIGEGDSQIWTGIGYEGQRWVVVVSQEEYLADRVNYTADILEAIDAAHEKTWPE